MSAGTIALGVEIAWTQESSAIVAASSRRDVQSPRSAVSMYRPASRGNETAPASASARASSSTSP